MKFPEKHRILGNENSPGVFEIPFEGRILHVIASNEMGWDHVSVSLNSRIPNWREMSHVKNLFFEDIEWAYQIHAPLSNHINFHPYCLHLWRCHDKEIPIPPTIMV